MGSSINRQSSPWSMARRRRPKNYKIVNVATKSGGSTGAQTLIGKIDKIDAQGVNGFLSNVKLSVMVDEAEQDTGAIMTYLTTDGVWSDNYVITAAATKGGPGGTVNLVGKRTIRTDADDILGNMGPVYVWVELADYVAAESFRYVAETWGRYITFAEQ